MVNLKGEEDMFTCILAYINSKYEYNYELLFIIMIIMDITLVDAVVEIVRILSN